MNIPRKISLTPEEIWQAILFKGCAVCRKWHHKTCKADIHFIKRQIERARKEHTPIDRRVGWGCALFEPLKAEETCSEDRLN